MDSVVEIVDAIKDADFRFEAEDYNGALAIYEKARKKSTRHFIYWRDTN
ncbi:hypothetical protein OL548_26865 [Lysinibacillus sp. MHQ-1]|nr:hypothetical protein OL548_26865 [Lysinibacillus sp. MHQ-1]